MKKLFKAASITMLSILLLIGCTTGTSSSSTSSSVDVVVEWEEVENKTLENGAVYTGWLYQGQPHGTGSIEWDDGSTFEGTFDMGKRVNGTYVAANGDKYVGSFVNDKKEGVGYMEYVTDCIYYGEFKNDHMHGMGYMRWPGGDQYWGEWKNGQPEGFGRKEFWNDQRGWYIYEGEMVNGLPHGTGFMLYPTGDKVDLYERYIGEWANGGRKGQGKFWFKDGCYYEGEFDSDWINGTGTFKWPNGNEFTGNFTGGNVIPNQTGTGKMNFDNSEVYTGQILILDNGAWVRHGQGTMTFAGTWTAGNAAPAGYNVLKFVGTFDKDYLGGWINGQGTMYYVNPADASDIKTVEGIFQGFDLVSQ